MIAPACPSLLQRKLELKKIQFIKSDKQIVDPIVNTNTVNINTDDQQLLIAAFQGTKVRNTTIQKLITKRPYKDLNHLVSELKLTQNAKTKLQQKLNNNDICF
jgi:type II secretory pathway component PulK